METAIWVLNPCIPQAHEAYTFWPGASSLRGRVCLRKAKESVTFEKLTRTHVLLRNCSFYSTKQDLCVRKGYKLLYPKP